jgi:hypothetical protein
VAAQRRRRRRRRLHSIVGGGNQAATTATATSVQRRRSSNGDGDQASQGKLAKDLGMKLPMILKLGVELGIETNDCRLRNTDLLVQSLNTYH